MSQPVHFEQPGMRPWPVRGSVASPTLDWIASVADEARYRDLVGDTRVYVDDAEQRGELSRCDLCGQLRPSDEVELTDDDELACENCREDHLDPALSGRSVDYDEDELDDFADLEDEDEEDGRSAYAGPMETREARTMYEDGVRSRTPLSRLPWRHVPKFDECRSFDDAARLHYLGQRPGGEPAPVDARHTRQRSDVVVRRYADGSTGYRYPRIGEVRR